MTTPQKMDRGTPAMNAHFSEVSQIEIRQTRRGWLQECLGCEARTEFKWFVGENQFAHSIEDASCCCRFWLSPCHTFKMEVKELNTEAELLTIDRPCTCPIGGCKCCCYQFATITSGGQPLGSIKEQYYYCVPSFKVYDSKQELLYIMHQPTCCGGVCVNCCAEGNPCTRKGCCKVSFRVFPAEQRGNTDGDQPYVGKILKKPKSALVEILTEANAFDVEFPPDATADQKALLSGIAVFINANFFEGDDDKAV